MADDTLSPQPDPVIEPGEPNPGGADAVDEAPHPPLPRDLDPGDNPVDDEGVPDEVTEPDDKEQAPAGDSTDLDSGGHDDVKGEDADTASTEPSD